MSKSAAIGVWSAVSIIVAASACGGGDSNSPPPASVATSIAPASATSVSGTVGQPVNTNPAVLVRDQRGDPMGGVPVTFAVTGGSGLATGGAATTNASGIATVGSWTLSTAAGANVMTASAGSLPPVTFSATGTADAPATLEKIAASENQSAIVNTTVPVAPGVVVRDQHGNPVAGATVAFAVGSGSGSVGAGTAVTNGLGVATAGSWTLGAVGENTLTASVTGLAAAVFTATGLEPSPVSVDGITPATLSPGVTMTISGTGFSQTPDQNAVTIDGVPGTVTTASATELTVVLPGTFACEPLRNVPVVVTVAGNIGSRQHPLRVGTARSLAVGESLVLATPADVRCNELANSGGSYMISVYNSSRVYTPTGAGFQLRGAASAVAPSSPNAVVSQQSRRSGAAPASAPLTTGASEPSPRGSALHTRVMEQNVEFLRQNPHLLPQRGGARLNQAPLAAQNVGDLVQVRIPRILQSGNFCVNFKQISARVAYVGTRSVVLEDTSNPLAGQIDTTYASIGQEFDNVMFGILEQYFGNPLAMDGSLSNTGKVNMVFSTFVNDSIPGIAGFVVSCDFANPSANNTSTNVGQYFYATAPKLAGNITIASGFDASPPRWRWAMRSTIIHEVKHITSFAERIARFGTNAFETFWLEEALARASEEMYERHRYGFAQRENRGWGQSTNVGPYCGVNIIAPPQCALQTDQPRGFIRAFEELAESPSYCPSCGGFYAESFRRSPIGRVDGNDFSFYSTGWALSRWIADHASSSEAAFLKGLVQSGLVGLINLEAMSGRSWADMQPEWLLAMALDDRPGFTPSNQRLTFPSWNLRDIFAGLFTVFQTSTRYSGPWPLAAWDIPFGNFLVNGSAVPGSGVFAEVSGVQSGTQLLELRSGPGVAAPAELRMAIVRIQ